MTSSRYGFRARRSPVALLRSGFLVSAPALLEGRPPRRRPPRTPRNRRLTEPPRTRRRRRSRRLRPSPRSPSPSRASAPKTSLQEPPPPRRGHRIKTSAAREVTVSMVGVERLPGSAYPAVRAARHQVRLTLVDLPRPAVAVHAESRANSLRIGFSGSIWNDLSYTKLDADSRLEGLEDAEPLGDADRAACCA